MKPVPKFGDELEDMERRALRHALLHFSLERTAVSLRISLVTARQVFGSIRVKLGARTDTHALTLALKKYPDLQGPVKRKIPVKPLSRTSRQCVQDLACGYRSTQIAARHKMAPGAVRTALTKARRDLGIPLGGAKGELDSKARLVVEAWAASQVDLEIVRPIGEGGGD